MTLNYRSLSMAAGLCATVALADSALADLPGALDRVPADATITISFANIGAASGRLEAFNTAYAGGGMDVSFAREMENIPGLNRDGSVAIAIIGDWDPMGGGMRGQEPPMVAVIPVGDYQQFVAGLDGVKAEGLDQLEVNGETVYAKSLGGGYACLSPMSELVGSFEGKAGNLAAHEALVGATGAAIAEQSDLFFTLNLEKFGPTIKAGAEQMTQMVGMQMAMMGQQGEQAQAGIDLVKSFVDELCDTGQAMSAGVSFGEEGLSMHGGVQFKPDTDMAGYLKQAPAGANILQNVPGIEYLMAASWSLNTPGLRGLKKHFATIQQELAADMGHNGAGQWLAMSEKVDAGAFVMGSVPGAFGGGLLSRTMSLHVTKDPAGVRQAFQESLAAANGNKQQGMTVRSSFTPESQQIDGKSVDRWAMRFEFDPTDPNSGGAQMGMTMIFGAEGGPGGLCATAKNAFVQTFSTSPEFMTAALAAAENGGGLGASGDITQAREHLPSGLFFEGHLGIGAGMKMVMPMMGMFTGQQPNIQVPDNLAPISFGATASQGGVRGTVYMPGSVMKMFAALAQDNAGGNQGGGRPGF